MLNQHHSGHNKLLLSLADVVFAYMSYLREEICFSVAKSDGYFIINKSNDYNWRQEF